MRICDLGVRIAGSELEASVTQLYDELGARGIPLRPPCYLGDEWFTPVRTPPIAHPVLSRASAPEGARAAPDARGRGRHARGVRASSCATSAATRFDHAYRFSRAPQLARSSSASPTTTSTTRASTARARTARASCATCRTGTRRRTPTRISPRRSRCGSASPEREWRRQLPRLEGAREARVRRRADARGGAAAAAVGARAGAAASPTPRACSKTLGRYYARAAQAVRARTIPTSTTPTCARSSAGEPSDEPAARFMRTGAQDDRAVDRAAGPASASTRSICWCGSSSSAPSGWRSTGAAERGAPDASTSARTSRRW